MPSRKKWQLLVSVLFLQSTFVPDTASISDINLLVNAQIRERESSDCLLAANHMIDGRSYIQIADLVLFEPQIMDNESRSDADAPSTPLIQTSDIIGAYESTQKGHCEVEEEEELVVDTERMTEGKIEAENDRKRERMQYDDVWSAINLHRSAECKDDEFVVAVDFVFNFKESAYTDNGRERESGCRRSDGDLNRDVVQKRNRRFGENEETAFVAVVGMIAVVLLSGFFYVVFYDIGCVQMVPWKTTTLDGYMVIDYKSMAEGLTPRPPQLIPF